MSLFQESDNRDNVLIFMPFLPFTVRQRLRAAAQGRRRQQPHRRPQQ